MKNPAYMAELKKLEIQMNGLRKAIPDLRIAGETLEGQELVDRITDICVTNGVADLAI